MNYRMKVLAITCLCAFISILSAPAQQTPYKDSDSDLKRLILDTLKAGKDKNNAKFNELVSSMRLSNAQAWFATTFGEKFGAYYSRGYSRWEAGAPDDFGALVSRLANLGYSHADVVRLADPCDPIANENEYPLLRSRQSPQPLLSVRLRNGNIVRTLQYFAYVDGSFRFVGNLDVPENMYPLMADAIDGKDFFDSAVSKPNISAELLTPHLLNRVTPIYPPEARARGVTGTVWINAIIGKDGSVKETEVVKGKCILAGAALVAVRQWRFTPPMVNGIPTEVTTVFRVNFMMSER
jgi:TonB family protein